MHQTLSYITKRRLTEGQGRVGRYTGLSFLAVSHSRRDDEETFTARLHANNTDIPALDDFSLSDTELELQYNVKTQLQVIILQTYWGTLSVGVEDFTVL